MVEFLAASHSANMPAPDEVRELYALAAAEPPLNEDAKSAELFANVYGTSLKHEEVAAAIVRDRRKLVAFVYGHPWAWAAQQYEWAYQLKERLGDRASLIENTYSLSLLARDPRYRRRGLGREVLEAWLHGIGGEPSWLQTADAETPARHLYDSLGFTAIGHGPDAPNGKPGLVMLRPKNQ